MRPGHGVHVGAFSGMRGSSGVFNLSFLGRANCQATTTYNILCIFLLGT